MNGDGHLSINSNIKTEDASNDDALHAKKTSITISFQDTMLSLGALYWVPKFTPHNIVDLKMIEIVKLGSH
jgi:hypothetical protein